MARWRDGARENRDPRADRGIKEAFRNYCFIGCRLSSLPLSRSAARKKAPLLLLLLLISQCRALFLSRRKAERAKIGETDESDVPCFDKWPRATRNERMDKAGKAPFVEKKDAQARYEERDKRKRAAMAKVKTTRSEWKQN
jgi:hypothetical protein